MVWSARGRSWRSWDRRSCWRSCGGWRSGGTLDLSGVVELKRNANGTFEAKFVDKVRILSMIRELMEERRDGELGAFLDGLCRGGEGDGA